MDKKTKEQVVLEVVQSMIQLSEAGRTKYFGMFTGMTKDDKRFVLSELQKMNYKSVEVKVCPRGIMDIIVIGG